MNLLRLTYFQASSELTEDTKWEAGDRMYEVFGTPDAIWNTWFHMKQFEELEPVGVHPRFMKVFNLRGEEIDMTQSFAYVQAKSPSGYR